jgi:hypothetical protein
MIGHLEHCNHGHLHVWTSCLHTACMSTFLVNLPRDLYEQQGYMYFHSDQDLADFGESSGSCPLPVRNYPTNGLTSTVSYLYSQRAHLYSSVLMPGRRGAPVMSVGILVQHHSERIVSRPHYEPSHINA